MAEARTALGIGTIMVAAIALAAPPARAAEGDWYASLYGGAMFLEDANNPGNSNALDFHSVAKTGYDARVAVGVYRAPQVRVEGEIGYRRAGLDRLSFNNDAGLGAAAGMAPLAGSTSASGHVSAISAMLNAYYDYDTGSAWRPYIDAGIGAARLSMHNVSASGVPVVDAFDTVFAYQLGLGLGYDVTKSLTLAVEYRYFTTLDPTFRDAAGQSFNSEFTSHNLALGVRYRF
ncbi:MAG TPA: outer membrane beta-barrel protein [Stellaceae bacterium]|nr:outer membrane beta-barrel protein [Stellaceae bacterium]